MLIIFSMSAFVKNGFTGKDNVCFDNFSDMGTVERLDKLAAGKLRTGYRGNAVESWSASHYEAQAFGKPWESGKRGTVIAIKVPIESVFCTAVSGLGCLNEQEYLIFGNNPNHQATVRQLYGY